MTSLSRAAAKMATTTAVVIVPAETLHSIPGSQRSGCGDRARRATEMGNQSVPVNDAVGAGRTRGPKTSTRDGCSFARTKRFVVEFSTPSIREPLSIPLHSPYYDASISIPAHYHPRPSLKLETPQQSSTISKMWMQSTRIEQVLEEPDVLRNEAAA